MQVMSCHVCSRRVLRRCVGRISDGWIGLLQACLVPPPQGATVMLLRLAYRSTAASSSVFAGAMLNVSSSTRRCSGPLIEARSSAMVCELVEFDIIEELRNIRLRLRPRAGEECRDLIAL